MRRARWRGRIFWTAWAGALAVLVLGTLFFAGGGFGAHGDGFVPVEIRGRVVDAAGRPVPDASVCVLWRSATGERAERTKAMLLRSDTPEAGRTGPDGRFVVQSEVGWGERTRPFGHVNEPEPKKYLATKCIRVDHDGHAPLVVAGDGPGGFLRGRWLKESGEIGEDPWAILDAGAFVVQPRR